MKILGVDPGSRITGYAILESSGGSVRFVEAGILKIVRSAGLADRLAELGGAMDSLLARCRPDHAAVEDLFHAVNAQSALKLAHARGVILASLAGSGLAVAEYTPLQVKKAVSGYGLADKDALRTLVERLLRIPSGVLTRDASDAVAVALCHAQAIPFREAVASADRSSAGRAVSSATIPSPAVPTPPGRKRSSA